MDLKSPRIENVTFRKRDSGVLQLAPQRTSVKLKDFFTPDTETTLFYDLCRITYNKFLCLYTECTKYSAQAILHRLGKY